MLVIPAKLHCNPSEIVEVVWSTNLITTTKQTIPVLPSIINMFF